MENVVGYFCLKSKVDQGTPLGYVIQFELLLFVKFLDIPKEWVDCCASNQNIVFHCVVGQISVINTISIENIYSLFRIRCRHYCHY